MRSAAGCSTLSSPPPWSSPALPWRSSSPLDEARLFELVRTADRPLGDQIVDGMALMIGGGRLAGGARLPSVRQLARKLGVSVFTVVTAYDRLVARGLIEPRQGAGFYVAARPGPPAPAPIESAGPPDTVLGLARGAL